VAKPAVFLDRDGTIIVDKAYLDNIEGVELLPGAGAGLAGMAALGYELVLITNQSGIGRGYFAADVVERQFDRLQALLAPFGVRMAGMEFCPHAPEQECTCRKPAPEMLLRAADRLDLDCARSFMIGDKEADVGAGHGAGCRSIRIGKPRPDSAADAFAGDLQAAAAWIRAHA